MQPYAPQVIDCETPVDFTKLKDRTVVVTGGANGLGEQYVRDIVANGGYVAFGDVDDKTGQALTEEFPKNTRFSQCDVTKWEDQLTLFKEAIALSPEGRVDVVIANAGIGAMDSVFSADFNTPEPTEPSLQVFRVNGQGVLYTTHLALYYFRKQNAENKTGKDLDQVLILGGSLAGYLGIRGSVEYGGTKMLLRALMRNLRKSEWEHNIRVAFIGPWFVRTKILAQEIVDYLKSRGADFATIEDNSKAVVRIITDPSVNGRTFASLPRSLAPAGYLDVDCDDPEESSILFKLQNEFDKSMDIAAAPQVGTSAVE